MRRTTTITLTPNPALDLWTTTAKVEPGPKLRCSRPSEDPGGGGVNVSRVIRRLGGETLAIFAAGGLPGLALSQGLAREDVPADAVAIAGTTRQSFSVQEEETGAVFRFVTPGPELSRAEGDALIEAVDRACGDAALVVGSGSLPPGAGSDFWARAAALARARGARFVLDSGDGVPEALAEGVFVYRENTSAIAKLEGRVIGWPREAAEWAQEKIAAGAASMVIVTEGSKGALLVSDSQLVLVRPPAVKTASAIGAGDSFVAAFCHAFATGETAQQALRLAVATASATLLSPGTQLCRKEDVDRLLGEMEDSCYIDAIDGGAA